MSVQPLTLEEARDKHIYINIHLGGEWIPAGAVTFNEAHGYAGFSYFDTYISKNLPPLNPATLNYRDTGSRHFVVDGGANKQMLDRTFWELLPTPGDFGFEAIVGRFPQYRSMNFAQQLYFLGNRIVGGLASYIKRPREETNIDSVGWLDDVRREAVAFHLREITRLRQNADAFLAMTSYGGVRPKAMYKDEDGRFWIAKFNSPTDPYDMAIAEHVAMNMAKAAGMKGPETKVLAMPSGENVFLTERFDRVGDQRRHGLALFSLVPGVETGGLGPKPNTAAVMATIVRRFSDFQDLDSANIVLKFLVDIGLNNVDNHLRNTRMILNGKNLWELSPAFDITFNPRSQPHIYNPAGLALSDTYLANDAIVEGLAAQTGLDPHEIDKTRQKVIVVAQSWEKHCDAAGMSSMDKSKIQAAINLGLNRVELEYRSKMEQRRKLDQVLRHGPKTP
jgi:hypothetical protein